MPCNFILNNYIDADASHFSELYRSLESDNDSNYYGSNSFKAFLPGLSDIDFSVIDLNLSSIGGDDFNILSFLSSINYKFDVI